MPSPEPRDANRQVERIFLTSATEAANVALSVAVRLFE
jgi:hypothetical protein